MIAESIVPSKSRNWVSKLLQLHQFMTCICTNLSVRICDQVFSPRGYGSDLGDNLHTGS